MAKPHEGPGYVARFPDEEGGGAVLMRYLDLGTVRRIRGKYSDDHESRVEEMTIRSIVEVSPDLADAAGVTGDLSPRGWVPVDDNEPGRMAVATTLGPRRLELLLAAWAHKNTVKKADLVPFLAGLEDVVE